LVGRGRTADALLFVVAARNESWAIATLWIGLLYHLACIYGGLGFGSRYFAAPSATLCFSAGALIYFWMKRGVLQVTSSATMLAFALWLANTIAAKWVLPEEYAYGPGYYLATFLFVIVVAGLVKVKGTPLTQRIDRALGDISYPVFLVQWLAGFITALAFTSGEWRGWTLTVALLPLTLGMAVALNLICARLIEPLRTHLRDTAAAQAALREPAAVARAANR
jgi:peptidoglycan/LPS O-acetylase OafA/YrhL